MGVLPTRHAPELGQRATAWVQGKASLALSSPLSRENTVGSQGAQQPAFESGKGQHCSHGWECSGRPAAAAKSLQSCPPLCDPIDSNPRLLCPWDSPGKNTAVGCHFLLQCMKVKSESEVVQSCLTLSDPMVCSLPGSSVHGIFQARVLEWGAIAFLAPLNWPLSALASSPI